MFELAFPWALVLLIVPLLIWFFCPRAPLQLPAALCVPFFQVLSRQIEQQDQALSRHRHVGILLVIWGLLVLVLAGPRWVGEPQPLTQEGYNIMMALDLSGSMEVADMAFQGRPVSRLAVVKRAAMEFVKERTGDKIGLILFGERAYLQTPLTYDRQNVLMRIEDATVGLAGKTTSIGDAIGLAVKRLRHVPRPGRVLILLTDGVSNSGVLTPLRAAELARSAGIKIYTIGLGAEVDPNAFGGLFLRMDTTAELDETTLKKVASMTGGRYFRATDLRSLQSIYQTINQLEKVSQDSQSLRPQDEYYPWPLGLALCLLIGWLGRTQGALTGIWVRWRGGARE